MSTQKIIWTYSERTSTGYAILVIGAIAITAGYILGNLPALLLGVFALTLGTHRLGYAHGMRDMHTLDNDTSGRLKDFSLQVEAEDEK